ncbi:MAG: preprotein translocase subunit SecG [Clostridia bacterium]|nr:preprotein translocase subunit SecG [Clostridia bacterium]
MFLFLQIALLVMGVILTVAVLMQHGKSYGLSGTIAGGAETFFGKEKGGRIDKVLNRATTVIGIVFIVVALLTFMLIPGGYDYSTKLENMSFANSADNYVTDDGSSSTGSNENAGSNTEGSTEGGSTENK